MLQHIYNLRTFSFLSRYIACAAVGAWISAVVIKIQKTPKIQKELKSSLHEPSRPGRWATGSTRRPHLSGERIRMQHQLENSLKLFSQHAHARIHRLLSPGNAWR